MIVSRFEKGLNYLIAIGFAAFALTPIVVIVWTALTPAPGSAGGVGVFVHAWQEANFSSYMAHSALVALIVVATASVCSIMAGFALGSMRFRGASLWFAVFLFGLMIPTEAIVVSLYFDLRALKLTDTIWAIVLPQIAQSVAFGTYWMRAYFRSTPHSLVEAATLDGASRWQILWRILVPTGRPAVVTLVLLTFMWTWNEFLIPLVMNPSGSFRTAPLALGLFKGQHVQATSLLAAAAVLVALPVVGLYAFLQRHFIQGMLEGALRE
ncbi:MAG TPA: carbohydrate ABC transporter permease [Beutenbergiaceae bacterium]|nr:carbohydrate ABC transporter permease [Beutenbergiaceae bacterium]